MFPTVTLQIEGMRYHIVHALTTHHTEIEAEVNRQLEAMGKSFDFEKVIRAAVQDAITTAVRDHLKLAIGSAFGDPAIKSELQVMVLGAMRRLAKDDALEFFSQIER